MATALSVMTAEPEPSGVAPTGPKVTSPPAELRTRWIQAAYAAAVAEGRYEAPTARLSSPRARLYRDGRLTLLAPFFDYAFYAHENPDFGATGLDELEHFDFFGWRRLRNPAPWFDTGYYLASNPDVLASGDNPFWHYILKGRAEGRATRRPRAAERAVLDALAPPEARVHAAPGAAGWPRLSADALAERLGAAAARARGLVVSVAHIGIDPAPRPLWATEALAFAAAGFLHLQTSPLRGPQALRSMPPVWAETLVALDGETLGVAADAALAKAVAMIGEALPARRALIARGVLGASVDGLIALDAALKPDKRLLWLNDFSTLCPSPRLLRNDVAFCGAPPPDSQACGICVYGEARRAHLAALRRLMERCPFTVVAPSQSALDLWRAAAEWPHAQALVAPPAALDGPETAEAAEEGEIGTERRPVRVAFVGSPLLANGWLAYARVLESCGALAAYAFHHVARAEDLRPSRDLQSVDAGPSLRERLAELRIDLVVAASEGPETFAWSAMEALAAGCDLLALRHSGHAAEMVETERRGRAFETDDGLLEFFASGKAVAYARERARFPRHRRDLTVGAASAALIGVEDA